MPRGTGDPSWDPHFQVLVQRGLAVVQEGAYHITSLGLLELEEQDAITGERLKEAGQRRVLSDESDGWKARALNAVYDVAKRKETLTIVDIRAEASSAGDPHHPNAWGSLLRSAAGEGWIEQTEKFVKSRAKSARGRTIRVWKSLIWSKI